MRPKTIVYFERLFFGTLLLGVARGYLEWDRSVAEAGTLDRDTAVAIYLTGAILGLALVGALTLLVSRRRSKVAMWFSIAMYVLGLPSFVQSTTGRPIGSEMIAIVQGIGQFVALGLLFTPSARRWMRREYDEPQKLRDVFD